MADRARIIILLILSTTMIFSQNCQNSGFTVLDGDMSLGSNMRFSMNQNMERPSSDQFKVGVFYTPYNKTTLGYDGNRPRAYQGNSIHDFKKKPFHQWPGPGSMMYAELPWLGTFNIEGNSVANPMVGELPLGQVFKYHAQWLYSMGADFIIWDSTNHAWLEKNLSDESIAMVRDPLIKLLDSWLELRRQGLSTPQVAIWAPIPGVQKGTYFIKGLLEIIDNPKYSELIFKYKDKPLVIVVASDHPAILAGRDASGQYHEPDAAMMADLKARYTVREMWANEDLGGNNWSYLQKCTDGAGGEPTPYRTQAECNQRISPDPTMTDRIEQIPVTFGYARDHISNRQSATPKRKGYTVLRQLETVFKNRQDVDIVTLSWFNTCAAVQTEPLCIPNHPTGLYNCVQKDGRNAYANGISAVQSTNGGHTLSFTDDYDEEYSLTFEPGGVTGDYYMRLINQALQKISEGKNPMELYDPEIFTIRGAVNSTIRDSTIMGWACLTGSSNSIEVTLKTEQGVLATIRADQSLEKVAPDAVSNIQGRCKSSRQYHGFVYKLTEAQKTSLSGRVISATGLSDSEYFADAILEGSAVVETVQPPAPPKTCSNGANNYPACNTCVSGQYFNGSSCQAALCMPKDSQSCSVANGLGVRSCNSTGSGYTTCVMTSCNSGYEAKSGACVAVPTPTPAPKVSGVCGTANKGSYTSVPSAKLCSQGDASSVSTTSDSYAWTCRGTNGGSVASCSATRTVVPQSTPNVPEPTVSTIQIYRYRNTQEMGHVFTASSQAPGAQYVSEGTAYKLYDSAGGGRIPIYRCMIPGSSREFQSTAANCEGQIAYGVLGYVGSPGQRPLYRCFHIAGGHLMTLNKQECEFAGYTVEGILGYTP